MLLSVEVLQLQFIYQARGVQGLFILKKEIFVTLPYRMLLQSLNGYVRFGFI